jgi:hypothetical protein
MLALRRSLPGVNHTVKGLPCLHLHNNGFDYTSPHPYRPTRRNYQSSSSTIVESLAGLSSSTITGGITATVVTAAGAFLATRFKVAKPGEYLVRTGIFINGITVDMKAFHLPYQTLARINMEPITYHCLIEEAMSQERISFNMPTVFTVGPKDDVEAEVAIKKAEGVATSSIRQAEGHATSVRIEAQGKAEAMKLEAEARAVAIKIQAEADAKAMELKAQADYIARDNESKGILKLRQAEAEGLSKLIESANGVDNLNNYLMVRDKMIIDIADKQSLAVRDMKPNITIWQTGQKDSTRGNLSNVVEDIITTGVPLVNAIKKSTGVDLLQSYRQREQNVNEKIIHCP